MTVVPGSDILSSLHSIQEDVRRQAEQLDRYRALKAIEQTIADFANLDDIARSLSDVRQHVQEQLDGTREFRALRAIERILPELSEVLALVGGGPAPATGEQGADIEPDSTMTAGTTAVEPAYDGSADEYVIVESETESVDVAQLHEPFAPELFAPEPFAPGSIAPAAPIQAYESSKPLAVGPEQDTEVAKPKPDAPPGAEPGAVPSLADSVAQLMAQSISPPREAQAPQVARPPERDDEALPHAEQAA